MVNRVMQAKEMKRLRQIRRLPRRMPDDDTEGVFTEHSATPIPARLRAEGVQAPRQPNRELMQGYKHRAASLGREDKPGKFSGIPPERLAVLNHIQRIRELTEGEQSFTILNTRVHRARVFFNPQRTVYLLLYENFYTHTVQASLPHCSKIELIDKFRAKSLQWVVIT